MRSRCPPDILLKTCLVMHELYTILNGPAAETSTHSRSIGAPDLALQVCYLSFGRKEGPCRY